jgi:Haemolymph juvenile hormone binding protein (JHBP).
MKTRKVISYFPFTILSSFPVEATNLFLKENGQEVLKVMMPQLKVKIANQIKKVVNHVLQNVAAKELLV